MTDPNFILLYVDNIAASIAFYEGLLNRKPVESSPNFALFALDRGLMFGVWSRHKVEPAVTVGGGGGEIAFALASNDAVDAAHVDWAGRGLTILQPPLDLDFGRNFLALDPDGHRLRVFCPREANA